MATHGQAVNARHDERVTMRKVTNVRVQGLFGHVDHSLGFRSNDPTILTGPNGVGKTQVLRLMRAAVALDVSALSVIPFATLDLSFADGQRLEIEREEVDEDVLLRFQGFPRFGPPGDQIQVAASEADQFRDEIPDHIQELPDGRWYDGRTSRIHTRTSLRRMFGVNIDSEFAPFERSPEIQRAVADIHVVLIDTQRLDRESHSRRDNAPVLTRMANPRSEAPITEYISQIRVQVVDARRESVAQTQSADLSFALRALANASARVRESDLRARYQRIVERYEDLLLNSLAVGEAPPPFPSNTTPTIRRILSIFFDDWEARLRPLLPVNDKLQTLRRILDQKFAITGKSTVMTSQGSLGFTSGSEPLDVGLLSSGEQHLVALYTLLLFAAKENSLILIDEPELSMHAAWKHAFLSDISDVARLISSQIVMATHSSAIVNGNWHLTTELYPQISTNDTERSIPEGEDG
jgi:ABC-type transport system involved in cytochrome c biogenesis ATPase subunit